MSSHAEHAAKRGGLSLRTKILLVLTVFNVAATVLFSISQYRAAKERYMQGLSQKLLAVTHALPDMLGPGYLDRSVGPDGIGAEEYALVMRRLNRFAQVADIRYLYTYKQIDGAFYCTSSNGTPEEMRDGTYTRYWQRYDSAPEEIFLAWREDRPVYAEVQDEWGHFYTLFLPLRTEAGTRFIAGADIAIGEIKNLREQTMRQAVLNGLAIFLVFLLISNYLSSRLSRSITTLAAYTNELAGSNFETRANSALRGDVHALQRTLRDEVGQLAASFLAMERRLTQYLKELTEATATKERIQNELRIAGEIQASMLPSEFIRPGGGSRIDLYAAMKPAKEAGGDLYDVIRLDDEHVCLAIADVSDKGMPAALFMTVAVTILRARATTELRDRPQEILSQVNQLLVAQNPMCQFVTFFLAVVNLRTGRLVFSDGGHNAPYLVRPGMPPKMLPGGDGVALGVMEGAVYHGHAIQLQPGDTLFVYTDGVTEAVAADETFYGEARLEAVLARQPPEADATAWVQAVMDDVFEFSAGHAQADDITVLALRMSR